MQFKPLQEYILIRPIDLEKQSGLYVPDSMKKASWARMAIVKEVGPGRSLEVGDRSHVDVEKGDIVLIGGDAVHYPLTNSPVSNCDPESAGLQLIEVGFILAVLSLTDEERRILEIDESKEADHATSTERISTPEQRTLVV